MKNKREHNFYRVAKHPRNEPPTQFNSGRVVWRCNDCDTEILLPDVMSQAEVNREMANKMLCIIPEPGKKSNPLYSSKGKLIN